MKRAMSLALVLGMLWTMAVTGAALSLSGINSATYVVMEVKSGRVLLEKGAHTQMYPASITKILTCALTLKHGSPQDRHTMTYEATHSIEYGSTHIALTEDEVVTVEDLLNATMIESANDAANGLAEYTAGDLESFTVLMNEQVQELGLQNTHFTNAHGLHNKNHYTSAYDMAQITRWAVDIPGFRELFGATEYRVPPTNKQSQARNIGTHHMMLVQSKYYYEGTEGGKLGWTPEARHTMVTLAERDGVEYICVVMNTRTQYEKFADTIKLLDYCFENYSTATMNIVEYAKAPIPVVAADGTTEGMVEIPAQSFPVVRPATVAKAQISTEILVPGQYSTGDEIEPQVRFLAPDGEELGTFDLDWEYRKVAKAAAPVATAVVAEPPSGDGPMGWLRENWGIAVAVVLALVLAIGGVLLLVRARNLRRLEQERRRQQRRKAQQRRPQTDGAGWMMTGDLVPADGGTRRPAYADSSLQRGPRRRRR